MGHVDDQGGVHLVGDLAEPGKIKVTGVAGPAGEDHLWTMPVGERRHFVHVHEPVVTPNVVGEGLVVAPGEGLGRAMGRVPPMAEVEAEHDVAGIAQRVQHGGVGVRTRVRLDIGVIRTEKSLGALDGKTLDLVDPFARVVVAVPGIAVRVLRRQDRPLRLEHRPRRHALGGDQIERCALTGEFPARSLRRLRGRGP